jgi:hypothetical protein
MYGIANYVTMLETLSLNSNIGINIAVSVIIIWKVTIQFITDIWMLVYFLRTSGTKEETYNRHM